MARPKTNHAERKDAIVTAATRVFAHYGYAGTTNRLVAQEIQQTSGQSFSPALIYHYFPEGKLQLFAAVMQANQPMQHLGQLVEYDIDAPPDLFLRSVARAYIQTIRQPEVSHLARIFFAEGKRHPELARHMFSNIAPLLLFPAATYLQRQIDLGRLKPINPFAAMFQFFGPLMVRAFITENLATIDIPFELPSDEAMIESHVQTFLHGLTPEC